MHKDIRKKKVKQFTKIIITKIGSLAFLIPVTKIFLYIIGFISIYCCFRIEMAILKLIVFVLVIFINPSTSFYIPGVAPIEYQASQSVEIKVIFDFFKDIEK